jgi:hypothetical protein
VSLADEAATIESKSKNQNQKGNGLCTRSDLLLGRGVSKTRDALLQEFQRQSGLAGGQTLTNADDEIAVVLGDSKALRLHHRTANVKVEGGGESGEEVVCGQTQRGFRRAKIEQRHVQQRAGHVIGPQHLPWVSGRA